MANQSEKNNQKSIRTFVLLLKVVIYASLAWFGLMNIYFLGTGDVAMWHIIPVVLVSIISHLSLKNIIKCWQMQLPTEATEYWYDILAMNTIVTLLDPWTHKIWHAYWLILLFVLWQGVKYLWDYITPKYEQVIEESEEEAAKRKKKEDKKEKVRYTRH